MSVSTVLNTTAGVLIPFAGTTLGAACVFFLRGEMSAGIRNVLTGFAAGVMVAASFWSLLNPSLELAEHLGRLSFIPAATGFLIGMFYPQDDQAHPGRDASQHPRGDGGRRRLRGMAER